jgi:hypothetical protein
MQNAETSFAEAVKLFKGGNAAQALPIFVQISEKTDSPNVRLYIGYCLLELGRLREAHQAFTLVAKHALELGDPKYDATRVAAQEQLAVLNLRLARLTISLVEVPTEFVITLDNVVLDHNLIDSPLIVDPGVHRIEAEAKGAKPVSREVNLDKGGTKTITLLFEKQAEHQELVASRAPQRSAVRKESSKPVLTTLGIVSGGLGVVGWGAFAVGGLQAKSTYNRLQAECGSGCSDAVHHNDASQGKTFQTIANVGLAVGIVGTITGATLLYLGIASTETAQPSLELAPGIARISYRGSF